MRYLKAGVVIFILFLILPCVSFSDEPDFPKIGFVKNDGANVRAGDNINFERLCKLEKGDPVRILGKRYSWFKIPLPRKAYLYIKSGYIDIASKKGIGLVNAERVNLRAGPGTRYSILGQVSKPKKLNILEEKNGWYKIVPPEGSAGWIHSSQITFSMAAHKEKVMKLRLIPETSGHNGNLTFSTKNSK